MKFVKLVIGILLGGVAAAWAENAVNLLPNGDMEEIAADSSPEAPKGWISIGNRLQIEADASEFQSGSRSLKVTTPDTASAISSNYIAVQPNRVYEVEASVLARGEAVKARPFVGLRISGNDGFEAPPNKGEQLLLWNASEEGFGFITKKARFATDANTYKVRIVLLIRATPRGTVNVDNVIVRETDQAE